MSEHILALKIVIGHITGTKPTEAEFVEHYRVVFRAQTLSKERRASIHKFLDLNPCKVSKYQWQACDVVLSLYELKASLHEMEDDKAFELDGFPCEFYKYTWELWGWI